ncbi:Murein L,D-transpeptidase YcbB/YkuD [Tistlia consotensis]|uniref:Murein L,D-transpeptidase YcbB/YkuD n=1 Tax=Tistlia consotensis USBA 355 TaxID=560819 RepID=A0A1Y6CL78_9PROT|nr:L,D-transpeptidase family protein [Tistlia consotensis]SMF74913.1 Murein L,D-transpeptidase YcbB/YkuD [Tistlia consotensis USBA 355]SNS11403.1 Murein L,D-transpeptidase YcbB/YkuD [Tistlia consotensis]
MLKQASLHSIGLVAAACCLATGLQLRDAVALTPGELQAPPAAAAPSDLDRHLLAESRLERLYRSRGFQPIWLDAAGDGLSVRGEAALTALESADAEGLDPLSYYSAEIDSARAAARWQDLDVLLSAGLLDYVRDLAGGRPALRGQGEGLDGDAPPLDAVATVRGLAAAEDVAAALQALAPANAQYRRLRATLAALRERAAAGGWPRIPAGDTLDPGMSGPRVAALRARLAATDGAETEVAEPALFDPSLEAAVRHFQQRNGLAVDGRVGPNTLAALDRPVGELIGVVEANMERWRWLPHDLGERYILVNTAAFEMRAVEDGRVVLRMPVVNGLPSRPTPMFSAEMRYLEVNPTWTVPPTIFAKDYLPKLRRDPGYLAQQNITLYVSWSPNATPVDPYLVDWSQVRANTHSLPYRLVQAPGPYNALGRIKFMLPNRYSVYLHDTPHHELFSRARRALSSGCVRLARPDDLAALILKEVPGWDMARLEQVYAGGERTRIPLARTWPVHVTYFTAWVDGEGVAHFYDDVYGRDADMIEQLRRNRLLLAEEPQGAPRRS